MSFVGSTHGIERLRSEFEELIGNLDLVLKKIRPNTNILNTKIGAIKDDLDNFERLNRYEQAKLFEIAIKYVQVNNIFNGNVDFNEKELIKIIEGKHDYSSDSDATYNDYIFEISMATRFLLSSNNHAEINIGDICDIIIDSKMAVECKYIHSRKNMRKNIGKARKQIERRVVDGQADRGFMALDLSHLMPLDKINDFLQITFKLFASNHETILSKQRLDKSVLKSVVDDRNFSKIIQSYMMHELESVLYSELGFNYDFGVSTLGIIFQTNNSFVIEYKEEFQVIPARGMTYFLNKKLPKDSQVVLKEYIHNLAVGI